MSGLQTLIMQPIAFNTVIFTYMPNVDATATAGHNSQGIY
jgi:hypothetical protein